METIRQRLRFTLLSSRRTKSLPSPLQSMPQGLDALDCNSLWWSHTEMIKLIKLSHIITCRSGGDEDETASGEESTVGRGDVLVVVVMLQAFTHNVITSNWNTKLRTCHN